MQIVVAFREIVLLHAAHSGGAELVVNPSRIVMKLLVVNSYVARDSLVSWFYLIFGTGVSIGLYADRTNIFARVLLARNEILTASEHLWSPLTEQ